MTNNTRNALIRVWFVIYISIAVYEFYIMHYYFFEELDGNFPIVYKFYITIAGAFLLYKFLGLRK